MIKKWAVRRWATRSERGDNRCFEIYEIATGKCASFPGTKKELESAVKRMNEEWWAQGKATA